MRIALVRHPAPLIAPGVCYGRLDVGLDASADREIGRIVADPGLQGAAQVWSSPSIRCRRPAEAIALARASPLTVDGRLQELDFGAWEGQAWDAVARSDLDRWAVSPLCFAPPGGESGAALIRRVRDVHAELCGRRQDCVVVSHGGPLKVLAALLCGREVDLLAPAPAIGSVQVIRLG